LPSDYGHEQEQIEEDIEIDNSTGPKEELKNALREKLNKAKAR